MPDRSPDQHNTPPGTSEVIDSACRRFEHDCEVHQVLHSYRKDTVLLRAAARSAGGMPFVPRGGTEGGSARRRRALPRGAGLAPRSFGSVSHRPAGWRGLMLFCAGGGREVPLVPQQLRIPACRGTWYPDGGPPPGSAPA
jgi:hypothetical protein